MDCNTHLSLHPCDQDSTYASTDHDNAPVPAGALRWPLSIIAPGSPRLGSGPFLAAPQCNLYSGFSKAWVFFTGVSPSLLFADHLEGDCVKMAEEDMSQGLSEGDMSKGESAKWDLSEDIVWNVWG